jgi:hypothetical protein
MTCHRLRLYFDDDSLRMGAEFSGEAEHLAHCAERARFVAARRELGTGLSLVRESAPEPSAALEAAVLENYRRQITGDLSVVRSKGRGLAVVCWTTALAVALVLADVLLFHPARRLDTSNLRIESARGSSVARPVTSMKAANSVPWTNTASSQATRLPSARTPRRVPQRDTAKIPASEEFRSLMYCDPISCGGAMQLIRVQLPSSAAAFEPGAALPNGAIYADVLVGSDGIARGIRVVQ